MGKTLWRSPNKKWEIVDDTENNRLATDWNDSYSIVATVRASDGWNVAYASIEVDGRIHTGDYGTKWEYFVPKTVEAKAFSLLRALYKEKKQKAMGDNKLPIQYAVIVNVAATRSGTAVPAPKFYRTYETAVKHAEAEWKALPASQKKAGAFVNVGRLSKAYASAKDVPERFGYSLLGSITSTYNSFEKRRRY